MGLTAMLRPAAGWPGHFTDLGRSLQSWSAASTPPGTALGSTGSKGRPPPQTNPERKQQPCVRCRDGHAGGTHGSADTGDTTCTQHVVRSLDVLTLRDNRLQDEPSRTRGVTPLPPQQARTYTSQVAALGTPGLTPGAAAWSGDPTLSAHVEHPSCQQSSF